MSERIQKITRLILLIQHNPRITVRRLQEELDLSQSQIYRYVKSVSATLPVRLEGGVVISCHDP